MSLEKVEWAVVDRDGRVPVLPGSWQGTFPTLEAAMAAASNIPGAHVQAVVDITTLHDDGRQLVTVGLPPGRFSVPWPQDVIDGTREAGR